MYQKLSGIKLSHVRTLEPLVHLHDQVWFIPVTEVYEKPLR